MRRRSTVLALTLAAACWLAAGPGFVGREASLCGHHHGHHMPSDSGPCFCDQMIGTLDIAAPDALPDTPGPVAITVERLVPAADPSPVPVPPSPSFTPETPPPIALA